MKWYNINENYPPMFTAIQIRDYDNNIFFGEFVENDIFVIYGNYDEKIYSNKIKEWSF